MEGKSGPLTLFCPEDKVIYYNELFSFYLSKLQVFRFSEKIHVSGKGI